MAPNQTKPNQITPTPNPNQTNIKLNIKSKQIKWNKFTTNQANIKSTTTPTSTRISNSKSTSTPTQNQFKSKLNQTN